MKLALYVLWIASSLFIFLTSAALLAYWMLRVRAIACKSEAEFNQLLDKDRHLCHKFCPACRNLAGEHETETAG